MTAPKVQKKLFKVCYNVVKMRTEQKNENACLSMEAYPWRCFFLQI